MYFLLILNMKAGCKENFTGCHSGKLKLEFTSPCRRHIFKLAPKAF